MIVGITGTRSGMTPHQMECVENFFEETCIEEFHHGDCIGVDYEAALIAERLGIKTVCHPPVKTDLRAWHKSTVMLEEKTYFSRNRFLVDSVDLLMVVPWESERKETGGTWYTHDYGVKTKTNIKMFWPDAGPLFV